VKPAMFQITKGDPTPEEIAALVAVLALASATTQPGSIGSTAARWRGSAPPAEFNSAALGLRDRCWRPWGARWSRSGPAHAPAEHRIHWAGTRDAS